MVFQGGIIVDFTILPAKDLSIELLGRLNIRRHQFKPADGAVFEQRFFHFYSSTNMSMAPLETPPARYTHLHRLESDRPALSGEYILNSG